MTQVVILLHALALTATGPVAGRVVSGPGLRTGQAVKGGRIVSTSARGGVATLLTTGGCLVHLAPGAAVTLAPPTKKTRCSTVAVIRGRVRLLAPARKGAPSTLAVVIGKHRVTLTGEGVARSGGVSGICMRRGTARLENPTPPGPARDPAPAPPPPAPTVTPTATPQPQPSVAGAGKCLWLTASGATHSAYKAAAAARDQKSTATTYAFATPSATVTIPLSKELASVSAALHSGSGGGSDVDGGGQSMCLDTGNEGSAADLGSPTVDVTKPPPPTQLRLILTLERRNP